MYFLYIIIKQVNNLGWLESWLIFHIWFQQYCVCIIYYYQNHNKITHRKSERIGLLEEAEHDGSKQGPDRFTSMLCLEIHDIPFLGRALYQDMVKKITYKASTSAIYPYNLLPSLERLCSRFNLISSWYSLLALIHNPGFFPRCWQRV